MAPKRTTRTTKSKSTTKHEPINPILLSIILFGVGIFIMVLCLVEGTDFWNGLREFFFLITGFGGYLVGLLMIYLAVLAGMEQPLMSKAVISAVVVVITSSVFFVFSSVEVVDMELADMLKQLTDLGKNGEGGGLIVALLGLPLVALFGRPVANIVLVLLSIIFVMLLTGITPYDIYVFITRTSKHLAHGFTKPNRTVPGPPRQPITVKSRVVKQKAHKINLDLPVGDDIVEEPGIAEPPFIPDPAVVETGLIRISANLAEEDSEPTKPLDENIKVVEAEVVDESFKKSTDYIINSTKQVPEDDSNVIDESSMPIEKLIEKAVTKRMEQPVSGLFEAGEPTLVGYELPSPEMFEPQKVISEEGAQHEMRTTADLLVNTLKSFGVETRMMDISRGPTLTRYELQPLAGVKISKITALADDLALNLATAGVRIEAPIPNKAAVGIEVPNKTVVTVGIRGILESREFISPESPLTIALGKDIAGQVQVADLTKMPHLLIAGSTGSGKSVCINSCIISFLCKSSPDKLRLILIDPKVVELADYNGIPHLLMPVVTEPRKAAGALGAAVAEMERRYRCFAENNVRDIRSYNKLANSNFELENMPYIAIIIDELADLMMVSGKEVEDYICRIAQKARAAGMHLIVATQRPSVDVITGLIKANIPSRIAFAVSSQVDSRTILDGAGAEKLLGSGDMLYMPVGAGKPLRIQGNFVKDSEIRKVLNFVKQQKTAEYDEELIESAEKIAAAEPAKGGKNSAGGEGGAGDVDSMFWDAAEVVVDAGMASTSLLQRRLKLGYARAARIVDELEAAGFVGPYEGSKPRTVQISREQLLERKTSN